MITINERKWNAMKYLVKVNPKKYKIDYHFTTNTNDGIAQRASFFICEYAKEFRNYGIFDWFHVPEAKNNENNRT